MNPEDRIRMLMEENAMLRARLGESNPYADARPLPPPPMLDDADLDSMEAEYNRRMSGVGPSQYIQKMPYKQGQDPGPYMKKMPQKGAGGNSSKYFRKM